MNDFLIYLRLGFDHITDPGGYDHILFVIALCAVYTIQQWRQVLILVTAFTIGHSITLALATLQLIHYQTDLIELLIPVTILITAVSNFFFHEPKYKSDKQLSTQAWRYALALSFGLIHGMGFSNYLRSLLGRETSIIQPLLAFNIGLEIGQLVIVGVILGFTFFLLDIAKNRQSRWVLIISGIVAGMALSLIINNEYLHELMEASRFGSERYLCEMGNRVCRS
ncbi:HupE/UreJ family protein [Spirosoma harenae]